MIIFMTVINTVLIYSFRLANNSQITNRLLGTKVNLRETSTSTTKTLCGTITSVNPDGESVAAQTYTVHCPATKEPTLAVLLWDDEIGTQDGTSIFMNLAEVMIFVEEDGKKC